MKQIVLLCLSLTIVGCTYNSKTHETQFTPFGAEVHEFAETAASGIKECGLANDKGCETKTSHDDYEQSKRKTMSNEELEAHVKKQQEKSK